MNAPELVLPRGTAVRVTPAKVPRTLQTVKLGRPRFCRGCGEDLPAAAEQKGRTREWCSAACQGRHAGRPNCAVGGCLRGSARGRGGFLGELCRHHATIFEQSETRKRLVELCRSWADVRSAADLQVQR